MISQWLKLIFIACFVVQSLSLKADNGDPIQAGKVVVRAIRGKAEVSKNAVLWTHGRAGEICLEGNLIRTDRGSSVDLFLGNNGPAIRLFENSILRFETLQFDVSGESVIVKTVLDLKAGSMAGDVKQRARTGSVYEVKTSGGIADIRGPDYVICESGKMVMILGSASMKTFDGSYSLKTGEMYTPSTRKVEKVVVHSRKVEKDSELQQVSHRILSPGYKQYLVGESFRRMHDGWPPLAIDLEEPFVCGGVNNAFEDTVLQEFQCAE